MENIVDFPDAEICIALLCGIANGEEVKAKLIDGSLSATLLNCRHVCRNNNLIIPSQDLLFLYYNYDPTLNIVAFISKLQKLPEISWLVLLVLSRLVLCCDCVV